MSIRSFITIVAFCLGTTARAETTDLSQYANIVYAQDLTAEAGSTATLSIRLKNNLEIPGWQLDMKLPDGVTFAKGSDGRELIKLSTQRTTPQNHNVFEYAMRSNGYMRVLCASTTNAVFDGNEGEVATIQLDIDENLEPGDYPIVLKEVEVSDMAFKAHRADRLEATLTVTPKKMTDPSGYQNIVYAQNLTAEAGSTATLSIRLKNNLEIPGWQLDLKLPDGVTFAKGSDGRELIKLSTQRTTPQKHNVFQYAMRPDGYMRVLCASTTNAVFDGNEGEVATIQLDIDENLEPGDYPIVLKEVEVSDMAFKAHRADRLEATLTVTAKSTPEYAKGYVVAIAPLTLGDTGGESATADIYFNVEPDVVQGKTVEFDVIFPEAWVKNYMVADVVKNVSLGSRFYTLTDPTENTDGSWHFVLTAKSQGKYFGKVASTKIGSFTIYQDGGGDNEDYAIPAGMYPIKVKNVEMKGADGSDYTLANSSTVVTVGTPAESELELCGIITGEVCNALRNEESLKKLDLSDAVAIEGCLELKDGCDLIAPTNGATVAEVVYKRTLVNNWGTMCLPFEVTSDANVQYYQLKSMNESAMTFTPVETVAAGTPVVFRTNVSSMELSETDAVLKSARKWSAGLAGRNWSLRGTYVAKTIDPSVGDNDIYYISRNRFVYGDVPFKVAAYRAYFETPRSADGKVFVYGIDVDTTDIDCIENADGTVTLIYDMEGRRLNKMRKGINIINGKKIFVK